MHVLMISPVADEGGAEEVFYETAVRLRDRGHEIDCIFLADGPVVRRARAASLSTFVIETTRFRSLHQSVSAAVRIRKIVRRRKPDLIFSSHAKGHVFATLASCGLNLARVWRQVQVPEPPNMFDRLASRFRADTISCNARDTLNAQRKLVRNPEVCRLIYPGIDIDRFAPHFCPRPLPQEYGVPKSSMTVAIIGRLQRWKGQLEYVRAVHLLLNQHPDLRNTTRFFIVGGILAGLEPEFESEIKSEIARLDLEDVIVMTGHQEKPEDWMPSFDVVVNASDSEPFGLVIIQAMAAERAVVAVDRGGPAEIVNHGVTGWLIPDNAPVQLARAISVLLKSPELRKQLGRAGREAVAAEFGIEAMILQYESVLESVLKR